MRKPQCLCVQSDQDVDCPVHGLKAQKKPRKERKRHVESVGGSVVVNEIIQLRNWIKKHGKHGTDCYSKRNSERDCDCGLYEIRQSFANDTKARMNAPQPMFERIWQLPPHAGRLVSMCGWQDQIIIACEHAVFRGWMDYNTGMFKTTEVLPA